MMLVTNKGTAPRGVYVKGVIKFVQPGETRELALTGRELAEAKAVADLVLAEPVAVATELVEPVANSASNKKKAST